TIAVALLSRRGKRWRLFSSLSADREIERRGAGGAQMFGLGGRPAGPAAALPPGGEKVLAGAAALPRGAQTIRLAAPPTGVSAAQKHAVMRTLVAAAASAGIAGIVLVEHDMDLVASYADRIVALCEGRVIADLAPEPFFADPMIIETVVGRRRVRWCPPCPTS